MMLATLVVSTVLLQAPTLPLTASPRRPLGTLREQAAVQQDWLRYRLDSVLPRLMRQYKLAMWVVPMREYNEDPVFWSLVSATSLDRKSTRLNSSHGYISYAVFCLKKKKKMA